MIRSTLKVLIFTLLLKEMFSIEYNSEAKDLDPTRTCDQNDINDSTKLLDKDNSKVEDVDKYIKTECPKMEVNCCSKNKFDAYKNESKEMINFYLVGSELISQSISDIKLNKKLITDLLSEDHNIVPSDCLKKDISQLVNENKYSFDTIIKEVEDFTRSYWEVYDRLYEDHSCFLCDSRYSLVLKKAKEDPSSFKEYLTKQSIDDYFELLRKNYKMSLNIHLIRLLMMPFFCKHDLGTNLYYSSLDNNNEPFDEKEYNQVIDYGKLLEKCSNNEIDLNSQKYCKKILSNILDNKIIMLSDFEKRLDEISNLLRRYKNYIEEVEEDEEEDLPVKIKRNVNYDNKSSHIKLIVGGSILVIALLGIGFYFIRKE